MKPPWRPYQKGLKEAIARLMAAPSYRSPVSDTSEIGEWIDCLRFHEMMLGDLDAGALAETLAEGRIARYAPFGSLPRHVFQMVLQAGHRVARRPARARGQMRVAPCLCLCPSSFAHAAPLTPPARAGTGCSARWPR